MPPNRKAIPLLLILGLSVSAVGIIFFYSYLPGLIEHKTRQVLLQNTPFTRFNANVRHAGFYGIKVVDLEAGDKQNSTLSAGSININYSPTGLIQKRINGVDIFYGDTSVLNGIIVGQKINRFTLIFFW